MSVTLSNVGGTLTGGSSLVLANAGQNNVAGKVAFYTPTHTRLAAREVDFYVGAAKTTTTDAGVARAAAKVTFANRDAVEGCCTVKAGSVIVDLGIRWSLNQPDTLVDDALNTMASIVNSPTFKDAIKKGLLPQ